MVLVPILYKNLVMELSVMQMLYQEPHHILQDLLLSRKFGVVEVEDRIRMFPNIPLVVVFTKTNETATEVTSELLLNN